MRRRLKKDFSGVSYKKEVDEAVQKRGNEEGEGKG